MSAKTKKSKKPERKCIRCGCTQNKACVHPEGNCSWVGLADICTHCLTTEEGDVYRNLVDDIDRGEQVAGKQMKLFGEMITLGRIGIPF